MAHTKNVKGQGALEYLLLIGGAALIGTIVIVLLLNQTFPASEGIVNTNLNQYSSTVTLHGAFGGGGGSLCVGGSQNGTKEAGEQCDTIDFSPLTADCSDHGAFLSGTNVTCNSNCQVVTSACTPVPGLPVASLSVATGSSSGVIDIGYNVTANYAPGFTYEFLGDQSDLSTTDTVAEFDAYVGDWEINQNPAPSSFPTTPISGFVASTTYYFRLKACNGTGCSVSSMVSTVSGGGPATFDNFVPTGAPILNTGFARYNFTWDGPTGICPVGTVESGIVLGSESLFPTGSEVVTKASTMAFALLVASSTASFNPTAPPANADATGNAIKLVASGGGVLPGETNPSFGVVCDSGTSNFTLHSAKVTSTYPIDTTAPDVPASPSVAPGLINGGVISLDAVSTADGYLGVTSTNPAVNHTDVQLACDDETAMNTPALVDAAIALGKSETFLDQASGVALNTTLDYTNNLVPSKFHRCAVRSCDIVDGKTVTAANCAYSGPTVGVTSSKEAFWSEVESGTITDPADLLFQFVGGEDAVRTQAACAAPGNTVTYSVNLKAPTTANANYKVHVRARNTAAVNSGATLVIGASSPVSVTVLANTNTYDWFTNATTIASPGGAQTVTLTIPCSGTALAVEKIILTTDTACVPNSVDPEGQNCQ